MHRAGTIEDAVADGGDYTVVVTAKGFRSQTRPAKVHDNGVAVVIVDLRKKR